MGTFTQSNTLSGKSTFTLVYCVHVPLEIAFQSINLKKKCIYIYIYIYIYIQLRELDKTLVARQVFLVVTENHEVDRHTTKYDLVLSSLGGKRRRGGGRNQKGQPDRLTGTWNGPHIPRVTFT